MSKRVLPYSEGYEDGAASFARVPREPDEVDFLTPYYIGGYHYARGFHDGVADKSKEGQK